MKRLLALMCSCIFFAAAAAARFAVIPARAQYTESDLTNSISAAADWTNQHNNPLSAVGEDASDISVTAFKRAGIDFDYNTYLDGLDAVAQNYNDTSDTSSMQTSLMAASALGADTGYFGGRDFAGDSTYYRTLDSAGDYIGALTALDAGDIEIPSDAAVNRGAYVATILAYQLPDGSFGDIKTTADAVTALADDYNDTRYNVTYPDSRGTVETTCTQAISAALLYLSSQQSKEGDFYSLSDTAAVSMAMDAMGIGQQDVRFVKSGNTVMDGLLTYQKEDGSFSEDYNDTDPLATAYALSAMVSNARTLQNKTEYYDFRSTDTITISNSQSGANSSGSTSNSSNSSANTSNSSNSSSSSSNSSNSSSSSSNSSSSSSSRTSGSSSSSSVSRATARPRVTIAPRATIKPRAAATPAVTATPAASTGSTATPAPTKKPDLVGPVQLVGPLPSFTPEPEFDYNGSIDANAISTSGDNSGVTAAAVITGVFALAALAIAFMAKKKLWVFKPKKEKAKIYKATPHRRTEIHRHYEDRRKYENRKKYAERKKYKPGNKSRR